MRAVQQRARLRQLALELVALVAAAPDERELAVDVAAAGAAGLPRWNVVHELHR
jgi:hypothetical protein